MTWLTSNLEERRSVILVADCGDMGLGGSPSFIRLSARWTWCFTMCCTTSTLQNPASN